ncbi:MAG: DUF302 domain-containing protein [Gemmatimonadetes bacterium]|nr:DUF302 domain-containing protein [Gemmatimonadota bacterium]
MSDTIAFEVRLTQPYEQAVEKVTAALKEEGFGILTRIDVDKTLKEKIDVDFRPYVILGACNPALAHRALTADAAVGIMLPCNVTVEVNPDGDGCIARIGNPDMMLGAGGFDQNPALREVAAEARVRLERVAAALG